MASGFIVKNGRPQWLGQKSSQSRLDDLFDQWHRFNNLDPEMRKYLTTGAAKERVDFSQRMNGLASEASNWNAKRFNGQKTMTVQRAGGTFEKQTLQNGRWVTIATGRRDKSGGMTTTSVFGQNAGIPLDSFAAARRLNIEFRSSFDDKLPDRELTASEQKLYDKKYGVSTTNNGAANNGAAADEQKKAEEKRKHDLELNKKRWSGLRESGAMEVKSKEAGEIRAAVMSHEGGYLSGNASKDAKMEADARAEAKRLGVAYTGGTVEDVRKSAISYKSYRDAYGERKRG